MTEFSEQSSEQQKEAILQRAPFTRTFLDSTHARLNNSQWAQELSKNAKVLINGLDNKLGSNWQSLVVDSLLLQASAHKVFKPGLDLNVQRGLILSFVLIGYEISNVGEALIFTGNLAKRVGLNDLGMVNPRLQVDLSMGKKVIDTIRGTLLVGSSLSYLEADGKGNDKGDLENPFKDFLQGLDYSGI